MDLGPSEVEEKGGDQRRGPDDGAQALQGAEDGGLGRRGRARAGGPSCARGRDGGGGYLVVDVDARVVVDGCRVVVVARVVVGTGQRGEISWFR